MRVSLESEAIAFRQAGAIWRAVCHPRKTCGMREGLTINILGVVPSGLSPEPQTPVSPYVILAHSALPLLEPRVSGYE